MVTVWGVDKKGVGCVPCVHTLSTGKEGLMSLKTQVPNFLLLAALTFLYDYFNICVVPWTYTTGYLGIHSKKATFGCDINLLTS